MTDLLRRLSQQMCFALTQCSFERVKTVARELTERVGDELDAYHAASVYQILVRAVQKELGVAHCDLFLDADGVMILHGTTRLSQPLTPEERHLYSVQAQAGDEILGEAMSSNSTRLSYGFGAPPKMNHISEKLQELLKTNYRVGQLAIPLKKRPNHPQESVRGILYLTGPINRENQGNECRQVKKSGLITFEHLRRAQDLSVVVYRNAVTARLMELTDWLIGELAHSLAQRLQVLHDWCEKRLRQIASLGIPKSELSMLRQGLGRAFALLDETRKGISYHSKKWLPLNEFEKSEFSLTKLIEDVCLLMQEQAMQKGCRIAYDLKKIRPIMGYENLLRSAVFNLLDNAIKYSYKGRNIEVNLEEDRDGKIVLHVKNYGVGVPPADMPSIFEPYFRSRVPDQRGARKGSGIGLAIVKHAIESHSGKIKAVSTPFRSTGQAKTAEEIAPFIHETIFQAILQRSEHL
jgi:signal transduction histidine kinase